MLAGIFFIAAAVAAIIGLALEGPALNESRYIVAASGDDARVILGAFFEVILAISVIGTAVTLFPTVKRQSEGIALAYVAPSGSLSKDSKPHLSRLKTRPGSTLADAR